MVYLIAFIVLVVVVRIVGPIYHHNDVDRDMREAEFQHRTSIYGDQDR